MGRSKNHAQAIGCERRSFALLGLNGLRQAVDQLLLLGRRQLGIRVEPQEIARRHIAARYLALNLLIEWEAILARQASQPIVEIERPAPRYHIAGEQPRPWGDITIPRPGRLIAVAVEARALR